MEVFYRRRTIRGENEVHERMNPKVDESKKVSEQESIESLKQEEWQRVREEDEIQFGMGR